MTDLAEIVHTIDTRWVRLTTALEGVPHPVIDSAVTSAGITLKETCCLHAAWDGETIRRLDFVSGVRFEPPHNPTDRDYWRTWSEKQIAIKRIMPPRGVLTDMVGVHQRLLIRLQDFPEYRMAAWLQLDPHLASPFPTPYLDALFAWRETWQPPRPSIWQKFRFRT